jgi:RNA polymerase sigma-B factor
MRHATRRIDAIGRIPGAPASAYDVRGMGKVLGSAGELLWRVFVVLNRVGCVLLWTGERRPRKRMPLETDDMMLELDDRPAYFTCLPAVAADRCGRGRARIERRLFERCAAGDRRARDELIERWLPLARSVARRYERAGEPLDDLLQVAAFGLVKAIDRYDPALGNAFSSYAVPTIVGELKRHFRDHGWAVRPPRGLQELTLRVERAATGLTTQLDRAPTIGELAAATGSSDEEILEALQARSGRGTLSLQAPLAGDQHTALQDVVGTSDSGYTEAETRVFLSDLMTGLPRRTREILRLRFEEDLTQLQIGQRFGVSQMQISRTIRQAISQLRQIADQHDQMAQHHTHTT